MVEQVYRPRRPKESPLRQCLCAHFYDFIQAYPQKDEKKVLLFVLHLAPGRSLAFSTLEDGHLDPLGLKRETG